MKNYLKIFFKQGKDIVKNKCCEKNILQININANSQKQFIKKVKRIFSKKIFHKK